MARRLNPSSLDQAAALKATRCVGLASTFGFVLAAANWFAAKAKDLISKPGSKGVLPVKAGLSVDPAVEALFFDEIAEINRQSFVINTQMGTLPIGIALVDRVHVADRPAFLLACNHALASRQTLKVRIQQAGQAHFCQTEITLQTQLGKTFAALRRVATQALDIEPDDQSRELAHELRTPLAAIVGLAEALTEDQYCNDEMRRTYPALIASTGRNLIEMTETVLEVRGDEVQKTKGALLHIAKDCVAMLQPLARQKSITLFDRLPHMFADKAVEDVAMRQILTNLLSNAIKFSPENGSVELTAAMVGNGWVLKVTDNGLGLSPEDIARLGQKNFRSAKAAGIAGHGLGLSIVFRLVDTIGGRISFESRPGKGTQVAISFPGTSLTKFPEPQFPASAKADGQYQYQKYTGEKHAAA